MNELNRAKKRNFLGTFGDDNLRWFNILNELFKAINAVLSDCH